MVIQHRKKLFVVRKLTFLYCHAAPRGARLGRHERTTTLTAEAPLQLAERIHGVDGGSFGEMLRRVAQLVLTSEEAQKSSLLNQSRVAASNGDARRGEDISMRTVGREFLSTSRPWRCTLCNVRCYSQHALLGHAAGVKHASMVFARGAAEGTNSHALTQ